MIVPSDCIKCLDARSFEADPAYQLTALLDTPAAICNYCISPSCLGIVSSACFKAFLHPWSDVSLYTLTWTS